MQVRHGRSLRRSLVTLFLLFSLPCFGQEEKLGPSIRSQVADLSILVILKDQADLNFADRLESKTQKSIFVYHALQNQAIRTQGPIQAWLKTRGIPFQSFFIMNLILIENATSSLIKEIAKREDVRKIIWNPKISGKYPSPKNFSKLEETPTGVGENLISVGAKKVWDELKIRGKGIVVAGQDTGVDWTHPALKKKYRGLAGDGTVDHKYSFHDAIHKSSSTGNPCGYDLTEPCDDDQHGTHTMGTMVGEDAAGNSVGVAPEAQWIACRNMDKGVGTPARYIECFEFFLAPGGDPSKAPHVINNSWGCPKDEGCEGGEILPVIKALTSAGIMVVASAGNEGPGCGTIGDPPATYTNETLSVGAINHSTGKIADFSSRGPSKYDGGLGPDVVAPGVGIRSSIPGGNYAQAFWSGTSMSGPHVVGEVALLWSYKPELQGKIAETLEIIRKSSDIKTSVETCGGVPGSAIPNNTYGYGSINIYKALTQ